MKRVPGADLVALARFAPANLTIEYRNLGAMSRVRERARH